MTMLLVAWATFCLGYGCFAFSGPREDMPRPEKAASAAGTVLWLFGIGLLVYLGLEALV